MGRLTSSQVKCGFKSTSAARSRLAAPSALCAVVVTALASAVVLAQEACDDGSICFERGEARFDDPGESADFLAAWHEKLGLTGEESFVCERRSWYGQFNRFPNYAYHCVQSVVAGYATKDLYFTVNFWDGDDGVRSIRCRCVREDEAIASPVIRSDEAVLRGLRYVYAHYPEVDPDRIETIAVEGPVVQPYQVTDPPYPYRIAWQVTYGFPWARDKRLLGEEIRGVEDAGLKLGIDAIDSTVFEAVDVKRNLFRFGIPSDLIDESMAEISSMPEPEQQFDAYQRFWAFAARGKQVAASNERRIRSLAEWEPNTVSTYVIYFSSANSKTQVASFLDEYEIALESISYLVSDEGQLRSDSMVIDSTLSSPNLADIERAFVNERVTAIMAFAESDRAYPRQSHRPMRRVLSTIRRSASTAQAGTQRETRPMQSRQ